MAFFKTRKGGDDAPANPSPAESIEAMRRRAKHRLIGAAVLVLLGVIGFPLLFDTQPRPVAVDIPIEIPDRNKVNPLPLPVPPAPQSRSEQKETLPATSMAPAASSSGINSETKSEVRPELKVDPKLASRTEPKAEPRAGSSAADGAKAKATAPEGRAAESPASQSAGAARFVVQVGAFADAAKAQEMRLKVEKAGLKTYTHVAETKDGKRIRVRIGPFATRADADKAADRIKGLDLPASILTL